MNKIEILEELKEWFNNFDLDSIKHKPEEYIQAISTLIAENKELKEKIKEINEEYNAEQKHEMENTIPKSKVEEEIDKLNKKEKDLQNSISDEEREEYSDANISFDLMDIDIRRETLQSLLGKE